MSTPLDDITKDLWDETYCRFANLRMQQWWDDLFLISALITDNNIKTIVEIGTLRGGLAAFLAIESIQRGITFHTFDINRPQLLDTPLGHMLETNPLLNFHVQDCFAGDTLKKILATSNHPIMLLCDGGNKGQEFLTFGPILKPGDVIGAHDWMYEFRLEHVQQASFQSTRIFHPKFNESYWYWAKID